MYPCHEMRGNQEWIYEDEASIFYNSEEYCANHLIAIIFPDWIHISRLISALSHNG